MLLLAVLVVVVGFALRLNPLLVILAAAAAAGLAGGMDVVAVFSAIGKAFTANRTMAVAWLVLPVIGVLERAGLQERAGELIARFRAATCGRILFAYFVVRQLGAALGLLSLGGHAQMVRPLIAPMAEAAAERTTGGLGDALRFRIRAHAAAVDNVAVFFGEDIFVAIGSVLLMRGFLAQSGFDVDPIRLASWSIPTAVLALVVHGARLAWLGREIRRARDCGAAPS